MGKVPEELQLNPFQFFNVSVLVMIKLMCLKSKVVCLMNPRVLTTRL